MVKVMVVGLSLCLSIFAQVAYAEVVTVTGVGETRIEAIKNAQREAVRHAVGSYVDAITIAENMHIVHDEILSKTQGFVRSMEIITEGQTSAGYTLKARIDVATEANSPLMQKLALVVSLRNPKILVKVETEETDYGMACVGVINECLIKEGFSHVMALENSDDGSADYLVQGRLALNASPILLPKYADYTNEEAEGFTVQTGLTKAQGELNVQIIKDDTKEVIGEFQAIGEGLKDTETNAKKAAISALATKAAAEVRKIFSRHGSSTQGNVQIIARSDDQTAIINLEKSLKSLPGVHEVTFKGYEGDKGTFYLDTDFTPGQLFRKLKEAGLNLFMEKATASVLEISVNS